MMPEKSQIELKKVKELIDLMIQNDLVEVEVVDGENRILLKRPQPCQPQPVFTHTAMAAAPQVQAFVPQQLPAEKPIDQSLTEIKSPIVGTFYAAPSPDSEPYVTIGSKVNTDTVVCIIEAMKVMNEIKAETSGTIVEIPCRAGQAVEYGQVIFKVKPD